MTVTTETGEAEWRFPRELARMPEAWTALLRMHLAGVDGRCRGCRSQVSPVPAWPCTLYRAAARARMYAQEHP